MNFEDWWRAFILREIPEWRMNTPQYEVVRKAAREAWATGRIEFQKELTKQ